MGKKDRPSQRSIASMITRPSLALVPEWPHFQRVSRWRNCWTNNYNHVIPCNYYKIEDTLLGQSPCFTHCCPTSFPGSLPLSRRKREDPVNEVDCCQVAWRIQMTSSWHVLFLIERHNLVCFHENLRKPRPLFLLTDFFFNSHLEGKMYQPKRRSL